MLELKLSTIVLINSGGTLWSDVPYWL